MRTVVLHWEEELQDSLGAILNDLDGPDMTTFYKEREAAIGYLADWSRHKSFPRVDIYADNPATDMVAVYRVGPEECSETKYVIGAVWMGDHFSFNS